MRRPTRWSSSIAHRSGGDARTALNIVELANETADGAITAETRRGRRSQAAARLRQGRRPRTTTSPPPSSSRCAASDRATPRSTTSPRWSKEARTRASSRGGWSCSRPRTSATPTRAPSSSRSRRPRPSSTSGCRRHASTSRRPRSTSPARRSRTRAMSRSTARRRTCRNVAPRARRRLCARGTADGSARARAAVNRHDGLQGFETSYLPEELEGRRYYEPSGSGEESSGRERLVGLAAEDREDHALERARLRKLRASSTMIRAQPKSAKPPTPVPNAGSASERQPSSSATSRQERVVRHSRSGFVPGPFPSRRRGSPSASGSRPAVVATAPPSGM